MKSTPAEDAKTYMSSRQIPQLFESMMSGLMVHRPEDHFGFLINCLQKAKDGGEINWNSFVEQSKSNSTLPPISRSSKHESSSDESLTVAAKSPTKDLSKTSPLPPINNSRETTKSSLSVLSIPTKVPIVLLMGPPGSDISTQCSRICSHYKEFGWVHLSVGELIRQKISGGSDATQKWDAVRELVTNGELAADDFARSALVEAINMNTNAEGLLIQGYPRTLHQAEEFTKMFGRYDLVLLFDFDEEFCYKKLLEQEVQSNRLDGHDAAIKRRLQLFKSETLPAIHHLDKDKKLMHLPREGHKEDIFDDIITIIDVCFFGKDPESLNSDVSSLSEQTSAAQSTQDSSSVVPSTDAGRKPGLPEAPIIFVMGAPESGRGSQCLTLAKKMPKAVLLSMGAILRQNLTNQDLPKDKLTALTEVLNNGELAAHDLVIGSLLSQVKLHESADAYIVEGFPRTSEQLEDFNEQIGGLHMAVMLDRKTEGNPITPNHKTELYASKTLEVAKHLDNHNKLRVIDTSGKTTDEVQSNLYNTISELLPNLDPVETSPDTQPEVVEEPVTAEVAYTTGEVAVSPSKTADNTGSGREESDVSKEVVSKEVSEISKQETEASKEVSELSKQETETSKEVSEISKQETETSKEVSELSKQETETSKEATDLEKEAAEEMAELKGKKVVFVVGGPGCGKGTQCAKIVEKYGFCHLSSGDLLREEVQSGSERGKELNAIMESGALVSMDVVLTLLKEAMIKNKAANGFLIDGYPRELNQGVRFESEIVPPACVLYFEVPDDVMVERLLSRAKTSGRVDDNEETIKKRLKTFHDHCDKVLEHYEAKSLLCKIDARGSVDDIFGEVVKKLDATN